MNIRETIIKTAYLYEGYKELKGNSGFEDDIFRQKMEAVGWDMYQAWCSYFTELVWRESYGKCNSLFDKELNILFSANAIRTYDNFLASGWRYSLIPDPGDLVIWGFYNKGNPRKNGEWFLGHIGVVTNVTKLFFLTMEGNTNSKGGREGIEVAEKKRYYNFDNNNGLRLLGFVKPKNV